MLLDLILKIFNFFVDLVFPPFCNACKLFLTARAVFCYECDSKIKPIISTNLKINKEYELTVFAISFYEQPLRSLILAKNISNILPSKNLGELIWQKTVINQVEFDYIVPVPLHWTRYAKRGFNQSEVIAKVIARKSGKKVLNIIKRKKRTIFQAELNPENRIENVKDAFVLLKNSEKDMAKYIEKYRGKNFLIVDDLMTTGATLRSLSKTLIKLEPKSIKAVVACRT